MKQRFLWDIGSRAVFLGTEGLLYLSYREQDGLFHWFLHLFIGASATLLTMALVTARLRCAVRHPLVWILAGHLMAMLPDMIWNVRMATHQPWMDLFLGHITAHFIPGRNWTWYAIFMASLAVYLYTRAVVEDQAGSAPSYRGSQRRRRHAVTGAVLLIVWCLSGPVQAGTPVWIDTDAAPNRSFRDKDDLFAILAAFAAPELEIRGISLVFGNHRDIAAARPDLQDVVDRFAIDPIPVHAGAGASSDLGTPTDASAALGAALSRETLTVLALGPLTNVATVLQQRPDFAPKIKRIIAVAGRRPNQAFKPPGGRVLLADLNFESDVEAFRIVLEQQVPLTLMPFELSRQLWVTASDLDAMRTGGPAARWLARQSAGWLDLWAHGIGTLGFHPFDGPAVTYLLSRHRLRCRADVAALIASMPGDSWWARAIRSRTPVLLISADLASAYRVEFCFEADSRAKDELLARIQSLGIRPLISGR